MQKTVSLTVNGKPATATVEGRTLLVQLLREMLGLTGIRVDKPEQIAPAWEQALSASRPVILEAITDPEVPTLPPHISFDQATKFMESMVKGEPHLGHMIKQTFKEAIEGYLPVKK